MAVAFSCTALRGVEALIGAGAAQVIVGIALAADPLPSEAAWFPLELTPEQDVRVSRAGINRAKAEET